MAKIAVDLPGLRLKNPLLPASGTFGFGDGPIATQVPFAELSGIVLKTCTLDSRRGNPQPQIYQLPDGCLNSVGLTNPGVAAVIAQHLKPLRRKYPALPLIASVGGSSLAEYQAVARQLSDSGCVDALELNISCPNVAAGGLHFGTDPEVVYQLTRAVKAVIDVPLYVKLTPNVTDIRVIAKAATSAGCDGLTLINTLKGLAIDVMRQRPRLGNNVGGLSGPAIKPIALRLVHEVHTVTTLPIIGLGGIETAEDVVAFMLAGASAVGVGSAHFHDPLILPHLAQALPQLLDQMGVADIKNLVGQLRFND